MIARYQKDATRTSPLRLVLPLVIYRVAVLVVEDGIGVVVVQGAIGIAGGAGRGREPDETSSSTGLLLGEAAGYGGGGCLLSHKLIRSHERCILILGGQRRASISAVVNNRRSTDNRGMSCGMASLRSFSTIVIVTCNLSYFFHE